MFFYVDEGGNTGLNLFDSVQPVLYYGVISSSADLDVVAKSAVEQMRSILGVKRIHASELGNDKLSLIARHFAEVQRKFGLGFDFYTVLKADHAVMCFFDQVFDSGMNDAVRWSNYWTPLRFGLLLSVAALFDEELAKKAWDARIERNDGIANRLLIEVCQELISRLPEIKNEGARSRIHDALLWTIKNPDSIGYNVSTSNLPNKKKKGPAQQISPNIIGFQFVMKGIANRLQTTKREASRIIVDQQGEFNGAQKTLAEFFKDASGVEFISGPEMPTINFDSMPSIPIEFLPGHASVGLELVDVMLWVHRRLAEDKPVSHVLLPLASANHGKGITDEISLQGIFERWKDRLSAPVDLSDLTPEQLANAQALANAETARIRAAVDD